MPNNRQAIDFFPKQPKRSVSSAKKPVSSPKKPTHTVSPRPTASHQSIPSTTHVSSSKKQPETTPAVKRRPVQIPQPPVITSSSLVQPELKKSPVLTQKQVEKSKPQKEKKKVFSNSLFSKNAKKSPESSPFIKNPNIEKRPLSNSLPIRKESYEQPEEKVLARPEEAREYGRKKESSGLSFAITIFITIILGIATGVGVYFLVSK